MAKAWHLLVVIMRYRQSWGHLRAAVTPTVTIVTTFPPPPSTMVTVTGRSTTMEYHNLHRRPRWPPPPPLGWLFPSGPLQVLSHLGPVSWRLTFMECVRELVPLFSGSPAGTGGWEEERRRRKGKTLEGSEGCGLERTQSEPPLPSGAGRPVQLILHIIHSSQKVSCLETAFNRASCVCFLCRRV